MREERPTFPRGRCARERKYPLAVDPIGLNREESAAYVGVSATLFDEMVEDGRMPEPREINSRVVWDREELRTAFKALPKRQRKTKPPGGAVDWSKVA